MGFIRFVKRTQHKTTNVLRRMQAANAAAKARCIAYTRAQRLKSTKTPAAAAAAAAPAAKESAAEESATEEFSTEACATEQPTAEAPAPKEPTIELTAAETPVAAVVAAANAVVAAANAVIAAAAVVVAAAEAAAVAAAAETHAEAEAPAAEEAVVKVEASAADEPATETPAAEVPTAEAPAPEHPAATVDATTTTAEVCAAEAPATNVCAVEAPSAKALAALEPSINGPELPTTDSELCTISSGKNSSTSIEVSEFTVEEPASDVPASRCLPTEDSFASPDMPEFYSAPRDGSLLRFVLQRNHEVLHPFPDDIPLPDLCPSPVRPASPSVQDLLEEIRHEAEERWPIATYNYKLLDQLEEMFGVE